MKTQIRLGEDAGHSAVRIDLLRLADTKMLVAANSGGGKSYLLRLIAERAFTSMQIIILDPEGEFASLREKLDMVLVSPEGEIPADTRSAGLLARKLLETRVSAIIDIFEMTLKERRLYVRLFIESLLSAPRSLWHPVFVMLDEAHMFAPERAFGEAESTEAVCALQSRGRKRGFAGLLATQRLSKLHKDAEAECNNVFIGRTWLDLDQKRAGDLLGMSKADRQILRDVDPGVFYVFGPALSSKGVHLVKVDEVVTTHPKPGERHTLSVPAPSAAIKSVLSQFKDLPQIAVQEEQTLERAKQDVQVLKHQLSMKENELEIARGERQVQRVEVSVLSGDDIALLEDLRGVETAVSSSINTLSHYVDQTKKGADVLQGVLNRLMQPNVFVEQGRGQGRGPVEVKTRSIVHADAPTLSEAPDRIGQLVGERRILAAIIQHGGCSSEQLSVLTGYKRSSRDTYIRRLRAEGFIKKEGSLFMATPMGYNRLPTVDPLPTGFALRRHWLGKLPAGERAILEILIEAYPSAVATDYLSEKTRYKRSSRDTYLRRLRARQLVKSARGGVVASEVLFGD